jgi:hypothetical protein
MLSRCIKNLKLYCNMLQVHLGILTEALQYVTHPNAVVLFAWRAQNNSLHFIHFVMYMETIP